jgi:hypothetical protein
MPIHNVKAPDGSIIKVQAPDGATEQQIIDYAKNNYKQTTVQPTPGMNPTADMSGMDKFLAGAGKAFIDIGRGAGQIVGMNDRASVDESRSLDAPLMKTGAGIGGNIVGNIAAFAPLAAVPGANTVAGAGLTGSLIGALQPVGVEDSRLKNTAIGGAFGSIAQYGGNKLASTLQRRATDKAAALASQQAKNAVRDATLQEAQKAGYTVPRSLYNPSFTSNRLESLAGKAATKQQAAAMNQDVTNTLAKQALGLPDDSALSVSTLEGIRKTASKPYQEIAAMSPQAGADLEALKQARNDAQGWFNAYNRSASPADLAKAKEFRTVADTLEKSLESHAVSANRPDLLPALADARKLIAKTYTVQRALNDATGDVSAPVIGRLFEKGKPLSGGLETVGKFRSAFPQVSQAGAKIPAPGVSKSEALAGALLGTGGAAITGNPIGATAALLPLASHPARYLALSKAMQKAPSYSPGITNKALQKIDPETLSIITRLLMAPTIAGASR